jgi:flagellar M-ring protein FliF
MNSEAKLISGLGFELFDKSEFGMTEFVQKINYQRALQGELTRTITSLSEVKYARVHLVLPEHSLFNQNAEKSRASVTLFLKDDVRISDKQILGIQRLVASAVPNMDVSAVTVVDQRGVTLSREATGENGSLGAGERLQRRQEIEAYLTNKVNQVLQKAFGSNQALVSVDVTLNLDQIKTTVEDYIPNVNGEKGMVRKREIKNQTSTDNKDNSVTTEVEYKLGRKVDQIVNTPGSIKSISVAVLVPEDTRDERIYQLEELVAVTVGLDKTRGDEIAVHAVAMAEPGVQRGDLVRPTNFQPYDVRDRGQLNNTVGNVSQSMGMSSSDFDSEGLEGDVGISQNSIQATPANTTRVVTEYYQDLKTKIRNGDPVMLGVVVLIGLIFLFTIIWIFSANRIQSENTLSTEEREKLLRQLNMWLDSDSKLAEESKI